MGGTLVDNIIENGVGGINIDECRVEHNEECKVMKKQDDVNSIYKQSGRYKETLELKLEGRFPSNVILTYEQITFDEVCGAMPYTRKNGNITSQYEKNQNVYGKYPPTQKWEAYNDEGSACRYFYCAKASKKDRDEGLDDFEEKIDCDRNPELSSSNVPMNRSNNPRKNTHPTVKPTALMQYLIRLVAPKGAVILDPFMGSGSTGKAAMYENNERNANYTFIGIEKEKEYCDIAKARIEYVVGKGARVE